MTRGVALAREDLDEGLDADAVVIGAGIAGLVVAYDLARAGCRVVVCEASDRVGGLLRRGVVAGLDVDLGAESFATRTEAVAALVADAGLDLELVAPRPRGAFLAVAPAGPAAGGAAGDVAGGTVADAVRAPLPARTVLGIPADPLAADVVAIIGADAAARAAAERDLPPVDATIDGAGDAAGVEPSLFALVEERCGLPVAARLVDTLCRSVYSRPAAELRLSALHPAMWRAVRAHGSLTAAAAELAQGTRAGAAVGGIAGGMWRLPIELARAARAHGAAVRTGVAVEAVHEGAAGLVVRTATGSITTRAVVVATGPAAAERLLAPSVASAPAHPAPAHPASGRVRVVAAAIDHPGLDTFPVGSGVIVDPALQTSAKALTHVTAKWAWAAAAAPSGRHLVRLSARDAAAPGLDTPAGVAREVALLTGVDVRAEHVVEVMVRDWMDAVASAAPATQAARRGIHFTGAAAAGTGLAAVIPHARALATALTTALATDLDAVPATDPATDPTRSLA